MGIVGLRPIHRSRSSSSPLGRRVEERSKGIVAFGAFEINM